MNPLKPTHVIYIETLAGERNIAFISTDMELTTWKLDPTWTCFTDEDGSARLFLAKNDVGVKLKARKINATK